MVVLTSKGYVDVPGVDLEQFGVVKSGHLSRKGKDKKMPDSEAKTRWQKENMKLIGLKLHRTKDADIIEYLESKGADKQKTIKAAIRSYMTEAQPTEEEVERIFEDEELEALYGDLPWDEEN
jgi:uncharacterized protein (DUF4415 family)